MTGNRIVGYWGLTPHRLEVNGQTLYAWDTLFISEIFVTPDNAKVKENVVAHFCHFVYSFESMDAGMA